MNKNSITLLAVVIAIASVVTPILAAINLARTQSQEAEASHMLSYARNALSRADGTADQFATGLTRLRTAHFSNPCAEQSLALMRDIDLSSSYLQAVGYVSGGRMICSSLGSDEPAFDLGPVDLITKRGVSVRYNLKVPFAPDTRFIALELDNYAVIVHKALLLDIDTTEQEVSLATFSLAGKGETFAARGHIDAKWITRLGQSRQVTFTDNGYVVAIVGSEKYAIGALAAVPVAYLDRRMRNVALWLVPIGVVAGLVLAYAVFWLAQRRMAMPAVLKNALKRRQFFLQYQPLVDLGSGRCVGCEALIRWQLPNGQLVPPDLFIPVAEQTGLITRITEHVMQMVAEDVGDIFRRYPGFHIAINLSSQDFDSPQLVESLRTLIRHAGGKASNLIVETTERGFLQAHVTRAVLEKIRATGIQIAIDDFGTGYSSLAYLNTFELDYLKIDKAFVDTIGIDAATSHVVSHIIEMAKTLKLKIIAEGVETEAQANYLRERGVHFAQGWLFGKPMSLSEIEVKLREGVVKDGDAAP